MATIQASWHGLAKNLEPFHSFEPFHVMHHMLHPRLHLPQLVALTPCSSELQPGSEAYHELESAPWAFMHAASILGRRRAVTHVVP